jgi:hypothetical protein
VRLHGARVDDVELYLGRATIVGVSRAIEQTFILFFIVCTYCLIQIILNVNLSTKVRRYLKSGKYREKFVEVIIFHRTFSATDSAEFCPDKLIIC